MSSPRTRRRCSNLSLVVRTAPRLLAVLLLLLLLPQPENSARFEALTAGERGVFSVLDVALLAKLSPARSAGAVSSSKQDGASFADAPWVCAANTTSAACGTEGERWTACKPVVWYNPLLQTSSSTSAMCSANEDCCSRRIQRRPSQTRPHEEGSSTGGLAMGHHVGSSSAAGEGSAPAVRYRSSCRSWRRHWRTQPVVAHKYLTAESGASVSTRSKDRKRLKQLTQKQGITREGRAGGSTNRVAAQLQLHLDVHAAKRFATISTSQTSAPDYRIGGAAPTVLLVEPSGAIGYGATLSSLLLLGVFNVASTDLYIDGVQLSGADITRESTYAIRVARIPPSPSQPRSSLLWFNGAETLSAGADQDCDNFVRSPVNVTFAYTTTLADGSPSVSSTTVMMDGRDGRPLLVRHCTYTPLLLSLATNVQVMTPPAAHALVSRHDTPPGSVEPTTATPSQHVAQQLTFIAHPQHQRIAGQPQQDWEARVRRFSIQNAPFSFSDVDVDVGLPRDASGRRASSAAWWSRHIAQAKSHVAAKDAMYSNVSLLWSVGEITGDLTTATVLQSLDVEQASYSLYIVLPSLTRVAHTVTLPSLLGLESGSGLWFWNQDWMVSTTYYDLVITGAFPRSTLFINEDTAVVLRPLRGPALSDGDAFASVATTVEDCMVSGAHQADTLRCSVAVTNKVYDADYESGAMSAGPLESCGGGVVVDVLLAFNTTSAEATSAVVNWSDVAAAPVVNFTAVAGFPIAVAANSVLRLESIFAAAPDATLLLRSAAAAADVDGGDAWVTLRFSFIYQNRWSGAYRLHCDGSAEDMQVSIRTDGDPSTSVQAHCIGSPTAASTTSHFRHAVVDTIFERQSTLYVNASCAFRLAALLDEDAASAAFCGVSLEATEVSFDGVADTLLPTYAVYELRLPMNSTADNIDTSKPAYMAALSIGGTSASVAELALPSLSSDAGCYGLPWQVIESAAAAPAGAATYGLRWGGLGYSHQTFPVITRDGMRYCHAFVAVALPGSGASLCPQVELAVRDAATGTGRTGLTQRVFCGSRSTFMDPISALQLRVPLAEVPRMVSLDALIPDTETGYKVYQYCVDVLFYLSEADGATGAYAPHGPLILTLLDTVDTPSSFVPWVRETVPDSSATSTAPPLLAGDTLYFTGKPLRYYDATGAHPLTGTRFSVDLAEVDVEACGDYFLVEPTGYYPTLSAQWVNASTIALPITPEVPGGWFNLTMSQGQAGDVYVSCGLSFRVAGTITSVTTADAAGLSGGTVVHIHGANLPMAPPGANVTVTIGHTHGDPQLRAPPCVITFSLGTEMTCTTPQMSAKMIAALALVTEESASAYTYLLPLNVTSHYYNTSSRGWKVMQSLNVDTVDGGATALSVRFRVTKMTVTDVWPLNVSRMEGNPTFYIRGTGMDSHSVLLCDVSTITPTSTPETTSCILCLPRFFSLEEIVCDALWPLNASAYTVYVSDVALDGDTGFTVHTRLSVTGVTPAFLYPYSEGVVLTIDGEWFASSVTTSMVAIARPSGTEEERQYDLPFVHFTNTSISALAPDLGWMAEAGGTLSLHVIYGLDQSTPVDLCSQCVIQVVRKAMMPSINSISPFMGQAPMLLHIYGTGFTKLFHSPKRPTSLSPIHAVGVVNDSSVTSTPGEEETYIIVGAEMCRIVDMLNTLIICNLTTPCSNVDEGSSVRLVSRSYGSTATAPADTSSSLFFYCTMELDFIFPDSGSTAGGQEVLVQGTRFPSNASLIAVTVAGASCIVTTVCETYIVCTTTALPAGKATTGPVVVRTIANGRESSCCSYTYDVDNTPTINAVSPMVAAAGAQLLIFGTNFPFTEPSSNGGQQSGSQQRMVVLFGQNSVDVTAIESSTRASVTIPRHFFGRDYLAVRVHGVGNSAPFKDKVTVLMTPSTVVPGRGGFHGRAPIRLVGTDIGPHRTAVSAASLFEVFVCGRPCEMLQANSNGEATCRTPDYMDEEMVKRLRASLQFPLIREGFEVYVSSTHTTASTTLVETAPPTSAVAWTDVSALFHITTHIQNDGVGSAFSAIAVKSPSFSILLKSRLHSRLLLYNVMLFLSPVVTSSIQLDLSNATCRLSLSTAEAEAFDLFSTGAAPANDSMWTSFDSGAAAPFTWPALQVGANSLNFNALNNLPTAAFVRIACEGFPVGALHVQELTVNGYQVGLDGSGGRCPVTLYSQRREDRLRMNSCASRTGKSCPIFMYRSDLTPIVTHYEPAYVLANEVGARVTLHGSGFGFDLASVQSILLDKTLCTPLSVLDTELECAIEGRVSADADWQVLWTNASGRGEAMLLSQQPFYAAVAWSSYLAWRGEGLPREGQIVVIPRYNTILLDTSPPALTGMLLYGVLIISDRLDIELRLGLLAVAETGALIAGSVKQPHRHKFTVTLSTNFFQNLPLYFTDDINSILQQDEPYLDKTLEVLGGTLQLHGMPPTVAAARLAVTAEPGDAVVTVSEWVPWGVGDAVALVTKDDANPHHIEHCVITGRVANATHTVLHFASDAPLRFRHKGDEGSSSSWGSAAGWVAGRPEAQQYARSIGTDVVHLTRTITIRGDAISSTSAVGASLWLVNTTTSQLSHVAMYRTGKRGSKTSYSVWLQNIHFPADRVVLDDIVVYDAFYRGVVLQETRHVVLKAVTVIAADGFGVASIGADDESATVRDSLLAGFHSDRGGIDTVAAGLFISSADVTLRKSEVCVSEGHGVWYALRFLYISATARTCPGQSAVAPAEANRIHHAEGHGLLIYPAHFNARERCSLSANTAAANDPAEVGVAEMRASVEFSLNMQPAGTLQRQLIFSCGLHGIYLPPSSGYLLEDITVMDCGLSSLFVDYATDTTVVRRAFVSASLPDGTCTTGQRLLVPSAPQTNGESSAAASSVKGERACGTLEQGGLQVQHGGHLSLFTFTVGDFYNGSAANLATLSAPSSLATTYPSGSFAFLRSSHLTVRLFNFSVVGDVGVRMLLAGVVALTDVDGQMTQSNASVFVFFGRPTVHAMPLSCFVVNSAEARGGKKSATADDSDDDSRMEQRYAPSLWARGREESSIGVSGKRIVQLVPVYSRNADDGSSGSKVEQGSLPHLSSSPLSSLNSDGTNEGGSSSSPAAAAPNVTVCAVASKHLLLLFVHVPRVDAATQAGDGGEQRCAALTAEVRERDSTSFVLSTGMKPSPMQTFAPAATAGGSAASFYLVAPDDSSHASSVWMGGAYAAWQDAVPTTEAGWGKAGYYTLHSSTNLTLAFRTANGSPCYPAGLSLYFDPTLSWPTSQLVVRTRVSPSASYFERQTSLVSYCATSPLVGCVTWADDTVRDEPFWEAQGNFSAWYHGRSTKGPSLQPTYSGEASTVFMSLAIDPVCVSRPQSMASVASRVPGGNVAVTSSHGPWENAPSLWASVDIASCSSDENSGGVGCMGPFYPYMPRWVEPAEREGKVASEDAFFKNVSWYSATAWRGGLAPWNVDLNDPNRDPINESFPTWYEDAYIIPFGTRVNLTLTEAVRVSGVLLVVGELYITAAAESSSSPAPSTSTSSSDDGGGGDSLYEVSITTLVVLGKLTVSVEDASTPRVRIVLGSDSETARAYRLDVDTLVYPGTLYAAGEVLLAGSTATPTVWKTQSMVHRKTTEFPAMAAMMQLSHVEEWCTWQARWTVAAKMVAVDTTEVGSEKATAAVLHALKDVLASCSAWMLTFRPQWSTWAPSEDSQSAPTDTPISWRRGDRVGLTSGSSTLYEAEERIVARDIIGHRELAPPSNGESLQKANMSTDPIASGAVVKAWSWSHGGNNVRDTTRRLSGFGVGSEVVHLTKTLELDCAIPRSTGDAGCVILITRQQHPLNLFPAPRFRASGVSIRHFGKGGQMRDRADPAAGLEPLTFVPAIYVNVSANLNALGPEASLYTMNDYGYAALIGSVVEASYGTALYTAPLCTRLLVVDSAIWFSEGGGVRLDGGGAGVLMESVVVAGTRYARAASTTVSRKLSSESPTTATRHEREPLSLADVEVTSLCSFLLNSSHVPTPTVVGRATGGIISSFSVNVTPAGSFIKNVVAGGSESEGFCFPWDGSGGAHLVGNNTAHSSHVGLFLFRAEPRSAAAVNTFFPYNWTNINDLRRGPRQVADTSATLPANVSDSELVVQIEPKVAASWLLDSQFSGVAVFRRWVLHTNRYIGVYSSSHRYVTIAQADIFANPIGVALAVHPGEASGSSAVTDSYIATFPRCSCTASMYSTTAFEVDDGPFWQVCQPTAYHALTWTPMGCGAVTFVDRHYHYTAVLAVPSYTYVPLSYNRSTVITAPDGDMLESATEGRLLLQDILFGAVGDLYLCESTACDPSARATTGRPLRSAAVMGTTGSALRSSASLSPIEMRRIQYAPSCAQALVRVVNATTYQGGHSGAPQTAGDGGSGGGGGRYRMLAGTPVAVLRLRPTAPLPPTSPAAVALAELKAHIAAYCADDNICTAADSDAVETLRDGYASPFGLTVVVDADKSAFGGFGVAQVYVPRRAATKPAALEHLFDLCPLAAITNYEMFVCPFQAKLYQVRLHSSDDRVSRGAAVPLLFTRTSLMIAAKYGGKTLNATATTVASSVAVVQPPSSSLPTSVDAPTISDAALLSSAAQLAFLVPQGMVAINIDPTSYSESFELRAAACRSSIHAHSDVARVVVPLLDESASVQVWDVGTQTLLESLYVSENVITAMAANTGTSLEDQMSNVLWPTFAQVVQQLSPNRTAWLTTTAQDNDNGVTASSLLFQLTCGTSIRVHQLVYATILLYTTKDADAVTQQVLRDGTELTVEQLLSTAHYRGVNTSLYNDLLSISLSDIVPDPKTGTGVSLTIKVQALDSFDYNITTATLLVTQFSQLFSAAYNTSGMKDVLTASGTVDADDSATPLKSGDGTGASYGSTYEILTISGVPFRVLLVIPPLLPSERHLMQTALSKITVVKRGNPSTASLVVLATVLPGLVLLAVLLTVVQVVLLMLRHRTRSTTAAQRKDTSPSMDVTEASVVVVAAAANGSVDGGDGRDAIRKVVVVWFAGLLPTTLGATLDKSGVTRGAEELAEVLRGGSGGGVEGTAPEGGTAAAASSARLDKSRKAAGRKIVRQLFLLPSYNVLGGAPPSRLAHARAAKTMASAAAPPDLSRVQQQKQQQHVVRATDPHRSLEADRQRYADEWRIGTRAMAHLTKHGVSAAMRLSSAGRDAVHMKGPIPSRSLWHTNTSAQPVPSDLISPPTCTSEGYAAAAPTGGRGRGCGSPAPRWCRGTPESTSAVHGLTPFEEAAIGGAPALPSADAVHAPTNATEHIIPVSLAPPTAGDSTMEREARHSNSNNAIPSSCGAAAASLGRQGQPYAAHTSPSEAAAAATAVSPPPTGGMPVAIQSILTTSILAGVSLPYPTSLVHVPGTAPGVRVRDRADPPLSAGAVGGSELVAAVSSIVSSAPGGVSEDLTLVLRGRGNISFTTPDADLGATRALRGVGNVAPATSARPADENTGSVFDAGS